MKNRAVAWIWYLAGAVAIYLVHRPWNDLGGLAGERLRWLERFSLYASLAVGWSAGEIARGPTLPLRPVVRMRRLRLLFYPVAIPVALVMLWMRLEESVDGTGVLLTVALAYFASSFSAFLRIGRRAGVGSRSSGDSGPVATR